MGQEIERIRFTVADFERFRIRVAEETRLLRALERAGRLSDREPVGGFEIEAWLVDRQLRPAPENVRYLEALADPMASAELARFNVELNNRPRALYGDALRRFHHELDQLWRRADTCARRLDLSLLMIGILPTLRQADLSLANMSPLNRYLALNEQILRQRGGRPLQVDIHGREHLSCLHHDVMLEAAATSFQIHLQAPQRRAAALYNASIVASAATVAAGANSPFLFGCELWAETRIPLFEQSIEVGGFGAAVRGPLHRVGFGTGYARRYLSEVFEENLAHFPPLLPIQFDEAPQRFPHLRLHNGTIWRWNRPLVGFEADGTPHFRIEHRVLPAGPTLVDMIANAAFYYGLAEALSYDRPLPFAVARDNFYRAAKHGWHTRVTWRGGQRWRLDRLLRDELIPMAREGLQRLGLCRRDREHYLDIVRQRVLADQNGSLWQRRFVAAHGRDFGALTAAYLHHQREGKPVHTWPI